MKELLILENVSAGYKGKNIISNISFSLNQGDKLFVSGNNGSGKSTLLKTIARIIRDNSGQIIFKGKRINNLQPYELIPLGISFFIQGGLIMPNLTVEEHLILTLKKTEDSKRQELIANSFRLFPILKEKLANRAGNLSGGQKQALSCAILICQDTDLWLLDEPLSGLDEKSQEDFTDFFNGESQKTYIIVEHNNSKMKTINFNKNIKLT